MERDIANRVRRIICKQLDVVDEDLRPGSSFVEALGGDSLRLVELTLALEAEFEIDIPDEDVEWLVEWLNTVQDAIDYIEKHVEAKEP